MIERVSIRMARRLSRQRGGSAFTRPYSGPSSEGYEGRGRPTRRRPKPWVPEIAQSEAPTYGSNVHLAGIPASDVGRHAGLGFGPNLLFAAKAGGAASTGTASSSSGGGWWDDLTSFFSETSKDYLKSAQGNASARIAESNAKLQAAQLRAQTQAGKTKTNTILIVGGLAVAALAVGGILYARRRR